MSTFKTPTEIAAATEVIQTLEELKSGSLLGGDGINRALERLGLNDLALLAAVQSMANGVLTGGGTWAYASNTLTWSAALQVRWADPTSSVYSNQVAAASRAFPDAGGVAYLILDRATDGATLTVAYVASMAAFHGVLAGTTARADYFLLAYRSGSHIILADGRRILNNQSLSSDGTVDSQYAQSSDFLAVRNRQTQNHNLRLVGGGTLEWAVGSPEGTFSWSDDLSILVSGLSTAGAAQHSDFIVEADDLDLEPGEVAYVNLGTRAPGTGGIGAGPVVTFQVAAYDAFTPTADQLIIALHHPTDGRLYLVNGQAIDDGGVARLGGAVTGLQWYFGDHGAVSAEQVWDLTDGGASPGNNYPIGAHVLMVYRNGLKQKSSAARWEGSYPTGTLSGTIAVDDDYLEEDDGTGRGTRILWLRDTDSPDTDETATEVYRTWKTPSVGITAGSSHDPARTWPASDSYIEAFIGVQGQGPSPVEALRVEGEDPGDDLDGIVEFRAGTGIVLEYEDGKLKISIDSGAPVTSLDAGGGAQGGAIVLAAGGGIALDDSTPGTIEFALDAELADLDGVSADRQAAILGAQAPTATNPMLTRGEVEPVQGFDLVWSPGGTKARAAGGVLNRGASSSSHLTDGTSPYIEGDAVSNTFGGALVVGSWVGVYLHHDGAIPKVFFAGLMPTRTAGFGFHPSDTSYVFLASAYYDASGYVYPFSKRGAHVTLGRELDVSASFASAVGTLSGLYAWTTITPAPLPTTAGARARFRLRVTVADPAAGRGNLFPLYVRATGAAGYRKHVVTMASKVIEAGVAAVDCSFVEFEFDAHLDGVGAFQISLPDTLYTGSPSVWLVGYDEPKTRAAASALGT